MNDDDTWAPHWGEFGVVICLVGIVAFGGVTFGQWAGRVATIWPANGVLLAVLLTVRRPTWPAFLVGGFVVNFVSTIVADYSFEISVRVAVVNLAEVTIALSLLSRYLGAGCDLSRPRGLWHFALVAVVAPGLAASLNLGMVTVLRGTLPWANFTASFLAHMLGIVTVTPVVLSVRRRELSWLFDRENVGKTVLAFAALIGVTGLVFWQSRYPLLFLVLPPLVLVVSLRGLSGGALGLFLATLVSIGFTVAGSGPTTLIAGASGLERTILVQLFAAVAAIQVLVQSAILAERDRVEAALQLATDELARLATTDGLTGLANRRRLDEALAQECRRAARDQATLSLLMLDVDRFKRFNDLYGHQEGDQCLRAISTVVEAFGRRPGDVAARYGGEELAILLPATDETGAAQTAEAVRASIEALRLPHIGNEEGGGVVTVSIGTATSGPQNLAFTPEALIGTADAMLYEAKRAGRNRVITWTEQQRVTAIVAERKRLAGEG